MKLQELLISLGYDEPNIHERTTDEDSHSLVTYKNHKRNIISISLSYLLFSTPFLSLLEWKGDKRTYGTSRRLQHNRKENFIWCINFTTKQYHKINLVLLNTDAERIEYIESFTL